MWHSVSVLCLFVFVRYVVSILVSQSSPAGERADCFVLFVFVVPRDCSVALPHDATGLSAVCNCGIS